MGWQKLNNAVQVEHTAIAGDPVKITTSPAFAAKNPQRLGQRTSKRAVTDDGVEEEILLDNQRSSAAGKAAAAAAQQHAKPTVARNNLLEEQTSTSSMRDEQQVAGGKKGKSKSSKASTDAVEVFDPNQEASTSSDGGNPQQPRPLRRTVSQTASAWEIEVKRMIAAGDLQAAIQRPGPSSGRVRCYVRRVKGGMFDTHPRYELYLEECDTFVLAARRRKKSTTSSYIICGDVKELTRASPSCVGKLKSNLTGSQYLLWTPSDDLMVKKGFAAQSLAVSYEGTVGHLKGGPRQLSICLPLPDASWQPVGKAPADGLQTCLQQAHARELSPAMERKLAVMRSNPAVWDEVKKAHHLDFKGRVTRPSVKNVQLVPWDHNSNKLGTDPGLLFGKIRDHTYALDFAYPLSIQQAFAVALASVDSKICCIL